MIAAIIQARMNSTRLPGKTLMEIGGEPLLGHLVRRARRVPHLQDVIIATTNNPADVAIVDFANRTGLRVHRGSETDVLDRFYQTAKRFGVSVILRITPDCPLLDPQVAGLVVDEYLRNKGECDYVSNVDPPTFPDGLDAEVFTFATLERSWREAEKRSEREHVTPYMRSHPELFKLRNVAHSEDLSSLRWTVDEPRDLEFVRRVIGHLGQQPFDMNDVLSLLRSRPELGDLNRGIGRNEGYLRSLREDAMPENAEVS
jgi:spore coat polysaccharide biosynthesis protein SpsF (cytidylyltransferase family)